MNNLLLLSDSFFESKSIELLKKYDGHKEISTHHFLLSTDLAYFKSHLIKIGLNGKCKNFIATDLVQKCLQTIWKSSIIFEPNQILFYKEFTSFQVILKIEFKLN